MRTNPVKKNIYVKQTLISSNNTKQNITKIFFCSKVTIKLFFCFINVRHPYNTLKTAKKVTINFYKGFFIFSQNKVNFEKNPV